MKNSLLETISVAPSVKAESVSKFDVLAPDAYFTILEIVAPASVLVKVVTAEPIACAVVRVIEPATTDANTAFGVPRVDVCALIDAAESVATLESGVTGADAVDASEFPAALVATTVNV